MLSRLILLFVTVPLLELALLLQVGQWIGLGPTVALVVATGFAGAALARQQGLRAFLAVQQELAAGGLPGRSLLDGLSILVGGALLLTPGILTDVLGFSLIVPPSRRWLQGIVRRRLERRIQEGAVRLTVFGTEGGFGGFGGFGGSGGSGGFGGASGFGGSTGASGFGDAGGPDEPEGDDSPKQELGTHPPGRNPLRPPSRR